MQFATYYLKHFVFADGKEYTFGSQGGIFSHSPKAVPSAKFRESIFMGDFKGTSRELDRIIDELRTYFTGDNYDVLQNNCNSFSEALVQQLCHRSIPGYINRLAGIGSYFSCLLPPSLTSGAPVDSAPSSSSSTASRSFNSNQPNYGGSSSTGVKPFSGKGRRLGGKYNQ